MKRLLIVSHGQPSNPAPPEAKLALFGASVATYLPEWEVATATLAAPGSLDRAAGAWDGAPFAVYPLFMSDGWFVSDELPRRLAATGAEARVLPPLGLDAGLPGLVERVVDEAAEGLGVSLEEVSAVMVAHGSPRDPRPRAAAWRQAERLENTVKSLRLGFVDEAPGIAEVARVEGPAICVPLFAARNGHVRIDVARALEEAAFAGVVLPPIGEHVAIPELVAAAARAGG